MRLKIWIKSGLNNVLIASSNGVLGTVHLIYLQYLGPGFLLDFIYMLLFLQSDNYGDDSSPSITGSDISAELSVILPIMIQCDTGIILPQCVLITLKTIVFGCSLHQNKGAV